MNKTISVLACLLLAACQQAPDTATNEVADVSPKPLENTLASVLAAQPDEVKARYQYRHPQQTLEFFGVEPGMTVVEGLPGGGWYTKLLLPYLGENGHLIGAAYALEMYSLFGWATEEFLEEQSRWATEFPATAAEWGGANSARVSAFDFGSMPEELRGTADVVLFIRAMHNLARFEPDGGYLSGALADSYAVLKSGGVLGIVQHHARDGMSDEFASGGNGYIKKSLVIAAAERAGFEFVAESNINENPNDQPTEDDVVWRLPPSLGTSSEDPELRAELEAVGESNRMTLKFRKP
jgi:predicted methyltransferase